MALKTVRICTFNVENLFMRYKIFGYKPGGNAKHPILTPNELEQTGGFLPNQKWKNSFKIFDQEEWRDLTANVIIHNDCTQIPNILCLMEVENMDALRRFNQDYLRKRGKEYQYAYLIDSNDPRRIDVGVLSDYPINYLNTNMYARYNGNISNRKYVFSRDCLELEFNLGSGKSLTIFVNHLKSKYSKTKKELEKGNQIRKSQAETIRSIVLEKFPKSNVKTNFSNSNFVVLGDFNDVPSSPFLAPVLNLGLTDTVSRLSPDKQWTYYHEQEHVVSQIDYILLSPNLAKNSTKKPHIERGGIERKRRKKMNLNTKDGPLVDFDFPRFESVTYNLSASDHCPIFQELHI